jgi:2-keto-4-pentenoate hydratase/2-oxohepta-3-ene-1,7-dioic acid hydratase in catechol pathway
MRLCSFRIAGVQTSGLEIDGDRFVPMEAFGINDLATFLGVLGSNPERLDGLVPRNGSMSIDPGWERLPPLPRPPRNMFCIGTNYRAHFDEGVRPDDTPLPERPVVFTKPWTTLTAHRGAVPVDRSLTQKVDWEGEIAVVIGRGGRHIPRERAYQHVFGLTLANDVSARDVQLADGALHQWFLGKSMDGFCPMGPAIVSLDELSLSELRFTLSVNGELRQTGRLCDLLFDIPALVSFLSRYTELIPGDIILTGTPAGVGHWRRPQEYLQDGDRISIVSEQLGILENSVHEIVPVAVA